MKKYSFVFILETIKSISNALEVRKKIKYPLNYYRGVGYYSETKNGFQN